jgi:hypothetical protein
MTVMEDRKCTYQGITIFKYGRGVCALISSMT